MCKTSVYEAVQAVAEKVPGLKRQAVFAGMRTPALGSDLTSVKCNGEWLHLGLAVDDTTGPILTMPIADGWLSVTFGDRTGPASGLRFCAEVEPGACVRDIQARLRGS
jgi:hypothetical protein